MSQILHSLPVKKKLTKELKTECKALKEKNIVPFLKVILVGQNPASVIYTQNKKKYCEKIGAQCEIVTLNEHISEELFLQEIKKINEDALVDGCIIQLPLPIHLKHLNIGTLIKKEKDVDGFHPENLYAVLANNITSQDYVSCTPKGIMTLLEEYDIDVSNKNVVIVGRSLIVGKPLSMLMTNKNATVTLCHSKTLKLEEICKGADIIVCAVGKYHFFTEHFLNSLNNQIIIDVGISSNAQGQVCGDVDYERVFPHVSAITPVPGGVGPMTIVSLAQNLLQASKNRLSL